jgi:hypothetical protein
MAFDEAMVAPFFLLPNLTVLQPSVHDDNLTRYDGGAWTPADTWLSR